MPRILLIEDDRQMVAAIKLCLEAADYRVLVERSGDEAVAAAMREQPDLVILDLMLPGRSGTSICGELRRLQFDKPVLMVTGKGLVEDRVAGLGAGADDYLPKPFDERELLARVQALLRRKQTAEAAPALLELGDIRVDFERKAATRAGEPLRLTRMEFSLLELLARNAGRPVSRKTILDVVWGYARIPDTRTVDTHVWRLRRKLGDQGPEPRWIKSVAGQGYSLVLSEAPTGPVESQPGA